jgi:hypothetical protein
MIFLGAGCYGANLTIRGVIKKLSNHCWHQGDHMAFGIFEVHAGDFKKGVTINTLRESRKTDHEA